ncbi:hypothetical protein L7F22_068470 [Adiantum nelumboides]|nr:hypothetical protein [Adiantum nelumboides]
MTAGFWTFWEPASGQHSGSCGVCISVSPRLLSSVTHHDTLIAGRALFVAIDIDGTLVGFLTVYAPNSPRDRARFWSQLTDFLPIVDTWIVGGDFNNIESDSDWCSENRSVLSSISLQEQEEWDRFFLASHTYLTIFGVSSWARCDTRAAVFSGHAVYEEKTELLVHSASISDWPCIGGQSDGTHDTCARVRWSTIIMPTSQGGLDIIDPEMQSRALLTKLIFRGLFPGNEPWKMLLQPDLDTVTPTYGVRDDHIWTPGMRFMFTDAPVRRDRVSPLVRSLLQIWHSMRKGLIRRSPRCKEEIERQPLIWNSYVFSTVDSHIGVRQQQLGERTHIDWAVQGWHMPIDRPPDLLEQEYVDDTMLFCQYVPDTLDRLKSALSLFCCASRFLINWDKSSGFVVGLDDVCQWEKQQGLTWLALGQTSRYVGSS